MWNGGDGPALEKQVAGPSLDLRTGTCRLKFDYTRFTMAGGDSNPISRKLYARIKDMLVEQQRSPTGPLPHVDTIVDHLTQRSGSLQQCLSAAGRSACG